MTFDDRTIEACAQLAEQKIGNFWDRMETVAAIRALSHETHSSDGGGENRRPATTGNKSGAAPEAEQSSSATSFVRAFEEGQTSQARAGVAPGPSEASSAGALQGSQCNRGDNESDPAVTQDCAPAGTVRLSDARTIIAGIRQFGLAADGSDLRDLEAAIDRLSRQPEAEPVAWIEFADNGNIRFWTSNPARAWTEGDNGRPLRKFTLAELVALAASPRLDREKVALLIMNVRRRKYGLDDLDLNTLKKIKSDDGIVEAFAIADAIIRETR